jgi:hypothetical protein
MPWLDDIVPNIPQNFSAESLIDGVHLNWDMPAKASDGETASGYVIYRFIEGEKIGILDSKNILRISFDEFSSFIDTDVEKGKRYTYLITALDRLKNESDPANPIGIEAK